MKKNISLFLLATSLVAAIAVGGDGTGYYPEEDVTEEDTANTCPSGLVVRASDGQCVIPEEDAIDDSVSDMTEEIEDVTGDTTITDPCEAWAWLEGTEWSCGGGDRVRITLWATEDSSECVLSAITTENSSWFNRIMSKVSFAPPPPTPPSSFTIENSPFQGECTLVTDE